MESEWFNGSLFNKMIRWSDEKFPHLILAHWPTFIYYYAAFVCNLLLAGYCIGYPSNIFWWIGGATLISVLSILLISFGISKDVFVGYIHPIIVLVHILLTLFYIIVAIGVSTSYWFWTNTFLLTLDTTAKIFMNVNFVLTVLWLINILLNPFLSGLFDSNEMLHFKMGVMPHLKWCHWVGFMFLVVRLIILTNLFICFEDDMFNGMNKTFVVFTFMSSILMIVEFLFFLMFTPLVAKKQTDEKVSNWTIWAFVWTFILHVILIIFALSDAIGDTTHVESTNFKTLLWSWLVLEIVTLTLHVIFPFWAERKTEVSEMTKNK